MNATSLADHAYPLLFVLARSASFATASLAVLDGGFLLYVDQVRGGPRSPKVVEGLYQSPHNTALGKPLLAYLPTDPRRQAIGQLTLTKTGPKTITSRKRLNQELREIHDEDGLVEADEELAPHMGEIAAPIRNGTGEVVAAISLATTAKIDVEPLVRALGPHLLVTADQISVRLGYRRDDEARSYLPGDFYGTP